MSSSKTLFIRPCRTRWSRGLALALCGALVAALPATTSARTVWAILPGETELEQTAAADLAAFLGHEHGVTVEAAPDRAEILVAIGTTGTHPAIARAHARSPFRLNPEEDESYHLRLERAGDGKEHLYIVGQSPKGAMNGVFRFIDRNDPALTSLDEAKSPVFRLRAAGHKINQSPPPDWSEEDQARFYARNYINLVWGEKHGAPMSYEARRKYGLGLMAELRVPLALESWMNDPANAEAIYYRTRTQERRVVTPFGEVGRRGYLQAYRNLIEQHPDLRLLYLIAGDYNIVPHTDSVRIADGKPHTQSRSEVILEILDIAREAVGDRDILIAFWPWHAFYGQPAEERAFMQRLPSLGYGVFYNEAGNNDNWIYKLDNFNEVAMATGPDGRTLYGDDYISLVSAGGACESTNPVIAVPLPRVAGHKLSRLADVGARHFALWWGSGEGWAYSVNLAAIRNMIWEPELFDRGADAFDRSSPSPLLRRIAEQDFGPVAGEVLEYWRLMDRALVTTFPEYRPPGDPERPAPTEEGLHIYDWFQRMGTYTEAVFGGAYPEPITPATMANQQRFRNLVSWGTHPRTLENFEAVIANMDRAGAQARQILARDLPGHVRERMEDMHHWSELFRLLLVSQLNHLKGLRIMQDLSGEPIDSAIVRDALTPVVESQLQNAEALIELYRNFAPNFNIQQPHIGVVRDQGSLEDEIDVLRGRSRAERMWLNNISDLAQGKPAVASSWQSEDRRPEFVTDGSDATLWHSRHADNQWIYVDLENVTRISGVALHWRTAFATEYEVAVATDLDSPSPWQVIHHETNGKNAAAHLDLPEAIEARYVRMRGIRRGSAYGFALTRIAVFGEAE